MTSAVSTFRLDPRSDVGIAAQIKTRIAFLIADEELVAGERLPAIRELAGQLGVNVNTVRAAYAKLESEGLVRTRHGVGTVVLPVAVRRLPAGALPLGVNTVGVVIAGLDAFYLPVLRGIEEVAAEHGMLVLISDARDSSELASAMIRRLAARGVDGIIAVSVGTIAADERGGGPPVVHVDQPNRREHVLIFDGVAAGRAATMHLREHGHERIAILTPPTAWPNVGDLYKGYLQAVREADLDSLVAEVDEFSAVAGARGIARLLDDARPATAVFVAGESLTLGALAEAKARGLRLPDDLAMAGYADFPTAALVDPPLTMVSVPSKQIGERAMQTLSELIAGKARRPRRVVFDVELVVRASCGSH